MLNVILFGMDPQQAVEAPRFSTMSNVNSFYPHVYHPGRLDLEQGIPETTAEDLRELGHKIARAVDCGMGRDGVCPRPGDRPPEHWRRPSPRLLRHRALASDGPVYAGSVVPA